jgi:hypothetical protein
LDVICYLLRNITVEFLMIAIILYICSISDKHSPLKRGSLNYKKNGYPKLPTLSELKEFNAVQVISFVERNFLISHYNNNRVFFFNSFLVSNTKSLY